MERTLSILQLCVPLLMVAIVCPVKVSPQPMTDTPCPAYNPLSKSCEKLDKEIKESVSCVTVRCKRGYACCDIGCGPRCIKVTEKQFCPQITKVCLNFPAESSCKKAIVDREVCCKAGCVAKMRPVDNICLLPIVPAKCDADPVTNNMYTFDFSTRSCKMVSTTKGCDESANLFESEEKCMAECADVCPGGMTRITCAVEPCDVAECPAIPNLNDEIAKGNYICHRDPCDSCNDYRFYKTSDGKPVNCHVKKDLGRTKKLLDNLRSGRYKRSSSESNEETWICPEPKGDKSQCAYEPRRDSCTSNRDCVDMAEICCPDLCGNKSCKFAFSP